MTKLEEIKVVLLGKEFTGKTSLAHRFLSSRYIGCEKYQNTIATAYGCRSIEVKGLGGVKIGIWDTAGSERYESLSRMYYRGAHAAIICYDVMNMESWKRLEFWLDEILAAEESCKLYLCGNKFDLVDTVNIPSKRKRVVDYHNALEYAESVGAELFETSSLTGHNVEELFQKVASDYLSKKNKEKEIKSTEESIKLVKSRMNRRKFDCCSN